MHWPSILDLYRSELRAAFRERHIVINTILLPALLYPVILWVLFNGLLFIQGQNEGQRSRVALVGSVPADLEARFEDDSDLEIVLLESSTGRQALDVERVHVVVDVQPAEGPIEADLEITVSYDSSREHSAFAQRRVSGILREYRTQRLESITLDWISADEWAGFGVETDNVASGDQMGAMILGLLLPLYFVQSLNEQYAQFALFYGIFGTLFTAFGIAALLLATIGLYGVMSFSASNRTREIGVRLALGAQRRNVLLLMLRRGALQLAIGLVLGLGLAGLLAQGLQAILFSVNPSEDTVIFATVVVTLSLAGFAACFVPAQRAARVSPVEALRYE